MVADRREFIRLDVGYVDNPKVSEVLDASPVAVVLHVAAMCYSRQHRTDGVVPIERLARKVGASQADVVLLVSTGLVDRLDDGRTAVHDYLKHQETAQQIAEMSERQKAKARKRWDSRRDTGGIADGTAGSSASGNAEGEGEGEVSTTYSLAVAEFDSKPSGGHQNQTARMIDAGLITPSLRREFLVGLKESGARDTGAVVGAMSQDELRGKVEDWLAERDASNVVQLRAPVMHWATKEHHDSCRICQTKAGGTWDEVYG